MDGCRRDTTILLTIIPECIVHEGAIIVGIQPEQRERQARPDGLNRLDDQRLFSDGQGNALGSNRLCCKDCVETQKAWFRLLVRRQP
jgi:hypothetical protein